MPIRRVAAPLLIVLVAVPSCDDSGSGSITNEHETLVAVSPDEFLGDLPCSSEPGGITHYVATLLDVSLDGVAGAAGAAGASEHVEFALPSIGPIPCADTVASSHVDEGRAYSALIDGYDNPNIKPLSPGSPTMVDRNTAEIVAPCWFTRCGDPEAVGLHAPALALSKTTVTVRGCAPMTRATETSGTALLPLASALESAGASCEDVTSISVVEGELALMESVVVDCSTTFEVTHLAAGAHELLVTTADAEGAAGPALVCIVNIQAGEAASAVCGVESETAAP